MSTKKMSLEDLPRRPMTPRIPVCPVEVPPIIVNGLRWTIGSHHLKEDVPSHEKGLRGRQWTIRFHDRKLVRTDDLFLDPDFKTSPTRDTAIILEGWWGVTETKPHCDWRPAGDLKVFGPVPL